MDRVDESTASLSSQLLLLSADERVRFDMLLDMAWTTATNRKDRSTLKELRESLKKNEMALLHKKCRDERLRGWWEAIMVVSKEARLYRTFCEQRESSWCKQDQTKRNLYYPAFLLVSSIIAFLSVSMAASKFFEFSKSLEIDSGLEHFVMADVDSLVIASAIVPAAIGLALGAMLAIRFLGGSVAWSYVGGSLPGFGGVWKLMATAEVLRWIGLLVHSKTIPECLNIVGAIAEYPVNRAIVIRIERRYAEVEDLGRAIGSTSWCPHWASAYLSTSLDQKQIAENCRAVATMLELQAVQRSKLIARVLPLLILGVLLVGVQFTYSAIAANLMRLLRSLSIG